MLQTPYFVSFIYIYERASTNTAITTLPNGIVWGENPTILTKVCIAKQFQVDICILRISVCMWNNSWQYDTRNQKDRYLNLGYLYFILICDGEQMYVFQIILLFMRRLFILFSNYYPHDLLMIVQASIARKSFHCLLKYW